MIVNETKQILNKYNLYAKKSFGQNFLIKEDILDTIISKSEVNKNTCVIEIGPGIGSLTEKLAINAKRVVSYEIDPRMIEVLSDTLSNYDNVKIINKDFLKLDLKAEIENIFDSSDDIKIVANLPYYITTPIIFKILESDLIHDFTIMVQKEVGDRLTGKPNTKDYNALSVLMKYKTISEIVGKVPRNCFFPEPNVESVLLCIRTIKSDYGVKNEPKFLEFIQSIFVQRRKTLVNNVSNYYNIEKAKLEQILEEQNLNSNIRAEALNIQQIADLFIRIFD